LTIKGEGNEELEEIDTRTRVRLLQKEQGDFHTCAEKRADDVVVVNVSIEGVLLVAEDSQTRQCGGVDVKAAFTDHNVAGLQAAHAGCTVPSLGLHIAICGVEEDESVVTTGIIRVVNMVDVCEAKLRHGAKVVE
jgi:hypothetical protein